MKDSPNLDLLRSIAVALVVVSHVLLQLTDGVDPARYNLHAMGHVGVALFFVHTMLVLLASLERTQESVGSFFIRRAFRIYPLSIAVVLFMAGAMLATGQSPGLARVASNLLLVQKLTGHLSMIDPLWSLPFEVQMYLVLPALYAITKTERPVLWLALLYVGAMALVPLTPLVRFVPCFLSGVLAFVLSRRATARLHAGVLFGVVALAGIVGVPMLVAAGVPKAQLLWALCALVGVTIPQCRQLTSRPIATVAKTVATYSYGVYITHMFALWPLMLPGEVTAGRWIAVLVLLPALSYIAYNAIERRGIALGGRMAHRLAGGSKPTPVTIQGAVRAG